jgi:nitronate monooxygenase
VTAGTDAVIAQGVEAGGHVQGTTPLPELLRRIRPTVDVPLVAAGGIAERRGVEAALAAGADAVACGTAFLAAHEADVHPLYLRQLLAADGADTELTTAFEVGWPDAPHRVLRNVTLERQGPRGEVIATRDGTPIVRYSDAQPTRRTKGDVGAMALYAGMGVGSLRAAESAAAIVERLGRGVGTAAEPVRSGSSRPR